LGGKPLEFFRRLFAVYARRIRDGFGDDLLAQFHPQSAILTHSIEKNALN
jgi:hypothetical protein